MKVRKHFLLGLLSFLLFLISGYCFFSVDVIPEGCFSNNFYSLLPRSTSLIDSLRYLVSWLKISAGLTCRPSILSFVILTRLVPLLFTVSWFIYNISRFLQVKRRWGILLALLISISTAYFTYELWYYSNYWRHPPSQESSKYLQYCGQWSRACFPGTECIPPVEPNSPWFLEEGEYAYRSSPVCAPILQANINRVHRSLLKGLVRVLRVVRVVP